MKTGYSLLLGEYVPADQIRYGDIAGFQIVCPCCKDPVIKVERPTPTDVTEFLSHYANKPGTGECELRVASISNETKATTNREARGQTLKMFTSVLRDAMMLEHRDDELLHRAMRFEGVRMFSPKLAGVLLTDDFWTKGELDGLMDRLARTVDAEGTFATTGLSMSFRRRLAMDIVDHLRSPHAERSRNFAAAYAMGKALTRHLRPHVGGMPASDAMIKVYNIFGINDGGRAAHAWFGRLQTETQPAVTQYMELLDTAAIEMMQTFMRLPALAMLANHRAGHHPLSGIDKLDDLAFRDGPPATQTPDDIEGEDLPGPR